VGPISTGGTLSERTLAASARGGTNAATHVTPEMLTRPERRRVYVVEPYVSHGGTLMAYHLARILQQDFGLEAVAVSDSHTTGSHGIFRYDLACPLVTTADMIADIRDEDVLIANPSFSSLGLGLRARGTKMMYIQGFNTFDLLDCRFDHYTTVSSFVQSFIRATYGIDTDVVPPFISVPPSIPVVPWSDRPPCSFFVWTKGASPLCRALVDRLHDLVPEIRLQHTAPTKVPHEMFLRLLGENRYFLTLSAAEGFGLPALEAMAMGTTVVGFDGFGSREYMRSGTNCAVCPYPDIEGVAERIRMLVTDTRRAESLAEAGRETAAENRFSYAAFRDAWRSAFSRVLAARTR